MIQTGHLKMIESAINPPAIKNTIKKLIQPEILQTVSARSEILFSGKKIIFLPPKRQSASSYSLYTFMQYIWFQKSFL